VGDLRFAIIAKSVTTVRSFATTVNGIVAAER
jgi:hypothetical protein